MEKWIENFIEFMPILLKGTIFTVEITLANPNQYANLGCPTSMST